MKLRQGYLLVYETRPHGLVSRFMRMEPVIAERRGKWWKIRKMTFDDTGVQCKSSATRLFDLHLQFCGQSHPF